MSHEELRIAAIAFARRNKYDYRRPEMNGLGLGVIASETVTAAMDIPDVIGWRGGVSCLIECKASRADFFADAKKPQRSNGTGMGEYRYFFTPKELIARDELPSDWGHSTIVALAEHKPLIGNRCGKSSQLHWIVFMKPGVPE